jgi:hypothetical protein
MHTWQPAAQIDQLSSLFASLPPAIPPTQYPKLPDAAAVPEPNAAPPRKYRHAGSTSALVFGVLGLLAGLGTFAKDLEKGTALVLLGVISILGALAYRSGKKRGLGEAETTPLRQIAEIAALLLIAFLVLAQKDPKNQIATQPIANFVAPIWAIVAYLVAVLIPWRKTGSVSNDCSLTEGRQTHSGKVTTVLAFVLLIGVIIGIGSYVYEASPAGFARIVGQMLLPGIVLSVLASKRRVRGDIALVVLALFLIAVNGLKIRDTYDVRRFEKEVTSAEPAEREAALASSSTQIAAMLRGSNTIMQEANTKIDAIFLELNDGAIDALAPTSLADTASVHAYERLAHRKLMRAETAMQRVDAVLGDARQQINELAGNSGELSLGFKKGIDKRFDQLRTFYERRVDLTARSLREIEAVLALMRSLAGQYRIENGSIVFDNNKDAEIYNSHYQTIQALAAQEQELDQAFQADLAAVKSKRQQFGLD